jgi:DNA mismatch repair protein MutL
MGQIMGVFLLAEVGDALYIVDQHAAHEKILYNRYREETPVRQDLLIPYAFEAGEEEVRFMEAHRSLFEDLGISFGPAPDGMWEIRALPRAALSMEEEIVDFLKCRKGSPAELQKELYATMSCRNAIKEGDPIDPSAALELLKGALSLENPRCPHGRLLWFRLSRDELYGLVGRLV